MSDPEVPPDSSTTEPEPEDAEIQAEVAGLAATSEKERADLVLKALIGTKKELKQTKRRMAELEPIAARAQDVDRRLTQAQPIIDAVVTNPKLRAEAMRIVQGSRPSAETSPQPIEDDDARGYAEDMGFYLADNVTPDAARARRVLGRQTKLVQTVTTEAMRPLAGTVLGNRADQNVQALLSRRDAEGVPLATEEGIREVLQMLGTEGHALMANPQVAEVVLRSAIGADRIAGRTPKAPDEPVFLERQGGSRRQTPTTLSADEKHGLAALGLTEKEYRESGQRLEEAVANRRGLVLGQ